MNDRSRLTVIARRGAAAAAAALLVAASGAPAPAPAPLGEWRFDEPAWTGAAGEVRDSTMNGLHLTRYGAAATALATGRPGSCRYGTFGGNQDRVARSGDARLDLPAALTAMAWVHARAYPTELMTILSKDVNYEFHLTPAGQINWWWGGGARALTTTGAALPLNEWHHVAITYASGAQRIYVDGIVRAAGAQTGALDTSAAPFLIGADVATDASFGLLSGRTWNGRIDNVRLYDRALAQSEVQAAMTATAPCDVNAIVGFQVTTSRHGLYCLDHPVTVTPIDAGGNAVPTYAGTVILSTSTGRGSWLLQSGGGAFADAVADDGAATYVFSGGESRATFLLRYRSGPQTVDVDVHESATGVRDTDAEGPILFSPSGFTLTSEPLAAPFTAPPAFAASISAGADRAVHLTAYGQTPTDATCGVIDGYAGAKSLSFWLTRADPATGSVNATVDGITIAAAEAGAAAQQVVFTAGRAVVTLKYKDVGRVALAAKDETTGNPELPGGIRGATGSFVSKPADFVVTNVRRTADGAANPGAITAGGAVFVAAGRPFAATVTALDADGTATPNFGRESLPESVRFAASLVLPAVGAAPDVAGSFGTFAGGRASGTAFAWPEAGSMRLVPRIADGDYLAAGDVVGSASAPLGRFVPDRFEVSTNTPVLQTACPAGGFGYVGQPFTYAVAPVISATAVALDGSPTRNYTGALFRLTNATVPARAYSGGAQPLDVSGLPPPSADPAIVDAGGGLATLTYSAGTGLAYARGATPVAPFTAAVTLTTTIIDADGVSAAAATRFGDAGGIVFSAGAQQRHGRIVVRAAAGSELLDLPLPLTVQYWLDAARGFTVATDDACTAAPALVLRDWRRTLAAGETCVQDAGSPGVSGVGCAAPAASARRYRASASAGDFNLALAAPGAGNSGAVTVEAAAPAWLQYDWNVAAPGLENPSALATFGVYQGPPARVYQREVY